MSLKKFLCDMHEKSSFKIQEEKEIEDIEEAIKEAIERIFTYMTEKDIRLCASELLPAGGFYEETKIENPNEFDYMAVLDVLSMEDEVRMTPSCPGCVTLTSLHPERWSDFCDETIFRFSSLQNPNTLDTQPSFIEFFNYVLECSAKEVDTVVKRDTGSMHIIGSGFKSIVLLWERFADDADENYMDSVEVDIMPCVRVPENSIEKVLKDVPPDLHECVRQHGCHVVPKNCGIYSDHTCSQISFTRPELFLVRDMNLHHLKCYKIMKSISNTIKALCFDSYAVKTAMLNHYYIEKCSEENNIGLCVIKVYEYLKKCSSDRFLPTMFLPGKNVWSHSMVGTEKKKAQYYDAQTVLASVIINILDHISQKSEQDYTYEACIKNFEKLKFYLEKLFNGKIKIYDVERKMQSFLRRQTEQPEQKCCLL